MRFQKLFGLVKFSNKIIGLIEIVYIELSFVVFVKVNIDLPFEIFIMVLVGLKFLRA
jgi:hypothetical protein